MRKISVLTVFAILLLSLSGIAFAEGGITHSVSFVLNEGTLTVEGAAPYEETLVVIYSAGVAKEDATDEDILYYNVIEADENGTALAGFTTGSERGEFSYFISCSDSEFAEEGSFEFDPSDDNEMKSFSLAGKKAGISGNKITLTVESGTNVTGLIATFEVHEDALVYVDEELQESGVSRNDFSAPVVYKVVAETGDAREYTVKVTKKSASSGGGGGGGGGGSRGGSVISATPVKPEENKEEVKEEIVPAVRKLFSDVTSEHWASDSIDFMTAKDILSGYEDGSFKPSANITRAEFVKIIVKAFAVVPGKTEVEFTDVSEADWFAYYVELAASNGIINGSGDGSFNPSAPVTREDMAVIIARAVEYAGITLKGEAVAEFADSEEISEYAKNALENLNGAGIISGYPDNTLRPQGKATRAEACMVMFKILNK